MSQKEKGLDGGNQPTQLAARDTRNFPAFRDAHDTLLGQVHRHCDSRLYFFDLPELDTKEFEQLHDPLMPAVAAMLQGAGCVEDVRPILAEQSSLFEVGVRYECPG